jgi:hypothetical protein
VLEAAGLVVEAAGLVLELVLVLMVYPASLL